MERMSSERIWSKYGDWSKMQIYMEQIYSKYSMKKSEKENLYQIKIYLVNICCNELPAEEFSTQHSVHSGGSSACGC